jgi:hypothetical protein
MIGQNSARSPAVLLAQDLLEACVRRPPIEC